MKTGLVMFEWHALGHVALGDSYEPVPHVSSTVYDYFHLNSIQPQGDGGVLIGARNTWAAYMLSATGATLWRLGGKRSTFALGPGVRFAWQHDAELLPEGDLSIFDDEAAPPEGPQSRAIVVALDYTARTATLVRQLTYPGASILTQSQGNAQALPEGEELIGWGEVGYVSQFSSAGALTFDMHLPANGSSYRAYRFPWSATPAHAPAVAASAGAGGTTVYASWNGATAVTGWRVFAGSSPKSLTAVGQKKRLIRDGINAYDAVQVRVDFANGMSIHFHNNWITPPRSRPPAGCCGRSPSWSPAGGASAICSACASSGSSDRW